MSHPERIDVCLDHIVEAISRATRYLAALGNLEIIGEAATRIARVAPEFVAAHADMPWIEMRGMRNKMIHEYFDVDWDIVWRTVKADLPALMPRIAQMQAELRGRPQTDLPRA